jgi:hypothetical protein
VIDKISKLFLIAVLTVAVLVGAFLGAQRYFIELQQKNVSLCVDLNDLRTIAAYDKKPLGTVLSEVRKTGINAIGVFEETLPDAAAAGELSYVKGSGLLRLPEAFPWATSLIGRNLIRPERTYIYSPNEEVRERVYNQLMWALGEKEVNFLGKSVIEVNEIEEELRGLGLGLSASQVKYLSGLGFQVVPRVWNDPRYNLGNISNKVSAWRNFDVIIFDGEEILGYPDSLNVLAATMRAEKLRYGYIEIVKQDGDAALRRLMGNSVVRVNSVPKDELKKLEKDEVVTRFVRACRERKISMIYLRPFLPPQIDAYPVEYNLKFFSEVKNSLEKASFVIGQPEKSGNFKLADWQLVVLGLGVVVGAILLLDQFVGLTFWLLWLFFAAGGAAVFLLCGNGQTLLAQKLFALAAAIVFPTYAVIASLARGLKTNNLLWNVVFIVLNIVAETAVGIFVLVGLLVDYRFMLGVETFAGVKFALILPVLLVALYFILKQGSGGLIERIKVLLKMEVNLGMIIFGVFVLGGLLVFIARSGNFILPVPGAEKYFRSFLETVLYIRPRTKEFLIGYPFLCLAAFFVLRGDKKWLWLLASIGVIGPISLLNTYSHIHTPLMVSLIRSMNGLVLGLVIGLILVYIVRRLER